MFADAGVVVVILPVLSAGLRICELTVRVDETRRAEISWDGRPFAEARWVGSGLSHVYSLTGGPVVPASANAPAQQTIERALLEIEIAAQSAVRAMSPPPRATTTRRATPGASAAASPPTATSASAAWNEPTSEADAAVRRQEVLTAMVPIDARLQSVNASLPGSFGGDRISLKRERARLVQEKSDMAQELQRLKLWCVRQGTSPAHDKGSLWDVLRSCHRLLERMGANTAGFEDDIEMCLDAIEYVVPKRFLDEPERPKGS